MNSDFVLSYPLASAGEGNRLATDSARERDGFEEQIQLRPVATFGVPTQVRQVRGFEIRSDLHHRFARLRDHFQSCDAILEQCFTRRDESKVLWAVTRCDDSLNAFVRQAVGANRAVGIGTDIQPISLQP